MMSKVPCVYCFEFSMPEGRGHRKLQFILSVFTSISEHIRPQSYSWRPQNVHISPENRCLSGYVPQFGRIDPESNFMI